MNRPSDSLLWFRFAVFPLTLGKKYYRASAFAPVQYCYAGSGVFHYFIIYFYFGAVAQTCWTVQLLRW